MATNKLETTAAVYMALYVAVIQYTEMIFKNHAYSLSIQLNRAYSGTCLLLVIIGNSWIIASLSHFDSATHNTSYTITDILIAQCVG